RLSVRAGHADAAFFIDDGAEDFLAANDGDAALDRRVDFRVLPAHGGGDDDEIDAREVRRMMSDRHRNAALGEEVGGDGRPEITAGDREAAVGQDLSNATHSDTADADKMNALNVFKIHSV